MKTIAQQLTYDCYFFSHDALGYSIGRLDVVLVTDFLTRTIVELQVKRKSTESFPIANRQNG